MAPDGEHHHDEVVVIEDLGASQTGAESETIQVSAEAEHVPEQQQAPSQHQVPPQQQVPAPDTQAPRPSTTPQKASTPKRALAEAATKQAEKDKKKQKAPKLTQSTLQSALRSVAQSTPAEATVHSESLLSEFKTSFVEFKQGLMGALQKKGAAALSGLKITPAASAGTSSAATPPNKDTTVSLHVSSAAQQAEVTLLKEEDGFVSKRTESGGTYGSLEPYVDTWNNADLAEVSSNPKPHPAGLSAIAQRVFEVGMLSDRLSRGINLVDQAAQVIFYFGSVYFGKTYASPQSPRFGLNE